MSAENTNKSSSEVLSRRYLLILNSQNMVWLKREGEVWGLPMGLINRTDIPCVTPVVDVYVDDCSETVVRYACRVKGAGNGEGWFDPKNLPPKVEINSRFFIDNLNLR
ncbi:MAG: hypothetical protein ABSA43_00820 [Candidatus Microgenomates bacterium]